MSEKPFLVLPEEETANQKTERVLNELSAPYIGLRVNVFLSGGVDNIAGATVLQSAWTQRVLVRLDDGREKEFPAAQCKVPRRADEGAKESESPHPAHA